MTTEFESAWGDACGFPEEWLVRGEAVEALIDEIDDGLKSGEARPVLLAPQSRYNPAVVGTCRVGGRMRFVYSVRGLVDLICLLDSDEDEFSAHATLMDEVVAGTSAERDTATTSRPVLLDDRGWPE